MQLRYVNTWNFPLSNEVGVKGKYSIFQNKKGEIMLMMDARIGNPQKPRFIYDGKDVALLYRDENSSVALRHISESAHESLKNANEILVVEVFDDEVLREYIAPVRLVRDVNNFVVCKKQEIGYIILHLMVKKN